MTDEKDREVWSRKITEVDLIGLGNLVGEQRQGREKKRNMECKGRRGDGIRRTL